MPTLAPHPKAILLFGPTAAGKTAASLSLAKAFQGQIINADSRQVYQGMPIITAMPTPQERAQAPHHLFEFLPPERLFSAVDWLKAAKERAQVIWAEGGIPIFVGGTGFYLNVLTDGISSIPIVDMGILNALQERVNTEGLSKLYAELQKVDPLWAKSITPEDTQRIMRGLSIYQQTGKPLSQWQKEPKKGALKASFLKMAISPPAEVLNKRIHLRYEAMMKDGVLDEARHLYDHHIKNLPMDEIIPPAFKSIGLFDYARYFKGEITEAEAHGCVQQKMRQYAKRQRTWLRNSFGNAAVFEDGRKTKAMVKTVADWLHAVG